MGGGCDSGGPAGPIGFRDYNPRPEVVFYARTVLTRVEASEPRAFDFFSDITNSKITNLEQAMTAIDMGSPEGRLVYRTFEWFYDHFHPKPNLP